MALDQDIWTHQLHHHNQYAPQNEYPKYPILGLKKGTPRNAPPKQDTNTTPLHDMWRPSGDMVLSEVIRGDQDDQFDPIWTPFQTPRSG